MRIFDKFIDRFRNVLIPFILIGVIVTILSGGILKVITNFIVKYATIIILLLGTVVFVVPIVISCTTSWTIPDILIFYDFIYCFVVVIMLFNLTDNKHYNQEGGYNRYYEYQNPSTVNRTYGYNNTFYTPINREKERNGGFTDIEVIEKKKLIRKKLEKKKLLDTTVL